MSHPSSDQCLVSITGANGGIARTLVPALLKDYKVRALFREDNALSRRWAEAGCEIVIGHMGDAAALKRLVAGAGIVVHCAAKVIGFSPAAFDQTNVEGTKTLVEAAIASGCQRFVHLSSISVYTAGEPTAADEYREDAALHLRDDLDSYTRTKLLAEQAVIAACQDSALEYVILRPTNVYGPWLKFWTLLPLEMIAKGRPLFLGFAEHEGLMDALYIEDLIQAVLLAMQAPRAAGEIFTISGESLSFRTFYGSLGAMVGRAPRMGSEARIRRIASMMGTFSRLSGVAAELERGLKSALCLSVSRARYPSTKALERLGYAPRVSLATGMLKTELALREQGTLPSHRPAMVNHDRHYGFRAKALVRPETEDDIVAAVREAASRQLPIKAIGALHSFVPIPATQGLCIASDRYRRVLAVEESRVTVQAGITIAELNAALREHQLALPVNGFYTEQTIAGAVSTATHGGSLHHGTLADQVENIRIIRPDGAALDIGPADETFHAVVTSLGLLGITSTLTLKCVPEFYLQSEARVSSIDAFLADFDAIQRHNDFVDALYHPQTRQVKMLLMNAVDAPYDPLADSLAAATPVASMQPSAAKKKLASLLFRGFLRVLNASRSESLNRKVVNKVIETLYPSPGIRRSDEALTFGDLSAVEPFPIDDMEFAVPYARAIQALQELSEQFERERNFPRFFPVHLRCSKAGEHWLAPNYHRDLCWFEFWHYPPKPELYTFLTDFFARFDSRMHWGKLGWQDAERLATLYDRWADFARLRAQWDPAGLLLNDHTASWFGSMVSATDAKH